MNGIWSAYSGSRFTVLLSANVSNASGGGNQRPNRIANGPLPSNQRSYHDWFNLNEFTTPHNTHTVTPERASWSGPRYSDADLGVFRSLRIREGSNFTFRAESFNTFNNVNFGIPNSTIGTAIAGTISTTVVGPGGSSARVLQLAAKLTF